MLDLEIALEAVGSLDDSSWVLGAREDLDSSTDLMDLEEELEAVGSLHSSSWVLGRVDYRKDESYSEWARRIEWEDVDPPVIRYRNGTTGFYFDVMEVKYVLRP